MHKNLKKVLDDKGISTKQYAIMLGVSEKTAYNKVFGDNDLTLKEAMRTRILFPEYSMEYLFKEDYEDMGMLTFNNTGSNDSRTA